MRSNVADYSLIAPPTLTAALQTLAADPIRIERRFSAYRTYTRKVGTRSTQAISKVALACLALVSDNPANPSARIITDIRIGAASLRETPIRCTAAEPPSSTSPSPLKPSPPPEPPSPPKPAPSTTSAPPPNTAPR